MSDFTPITTQEEFNSAIQERISRVEEKYSDYDDIKSQNAEYETTLATYKEQIDSFGTTKEKYDGQIAELQKQVDGYKKNDLKIKIAHEAGLPYELAGRLTGDDEDALRKDAEGLKKFASTRKAPPLHDDEGGAGNSKNAAMKKMLEELHF